MFWHLVVYQHHTPPSTTTSLFIYKFSVEFVEVGKYWTWHLKLSTQFTEEPFKFINIYRTQNQDPSFIKPVKLVISIPYQFPLDIEEG